MKNITNALSITLMMLFTFSTAYSQFLPPTCPGSPRCGESGGENLDPIITVWPPEGNVANVLNFIKWKYKEGATSYTLNIFNSAGTQLLHSATTSGTSLRLDFPEIGLDVGVEYVILIIADNGKRSNPHRFTLKEKADLDAVIAALQNDDIFNSLQGIDKTLRKAEFLHQNGWNLAAAKTHNINVLSNNAMEILKIINSFEALRLSLYPLPPE